MAVAERYRPYGTMIVLDRCHHLAVHHDIKTGVVVLEYASEGTTVIVDDLAAVKAAAALGLHPTIEAHLPTGMSFTYPELSGLGHYIEHDQYDGDSRQFLDSVHQRQIAPC